MLSVHINTNLGYVSIRACEVYSTDAACHITLMLDVRVGDGEDGDGVTATRPPS